METENPLLIVNHILWKHIIAGIHSAYLKSIQFYPGLSLFLDPYTSSVGIIRYSRLELDRYIMPFKATIMKIAKY